MTLLHYRVIVVGLEDGRFEAYTRAFPSLAVVGESVFEAVGAAREQMAAIIEQCARDGRRPPPPDREAVAIEMVSLPFDERKSGRPNVQVDVMTGKVHREGREVPLRGSSLALVVSLATHERDLSIEELCDRLYPGTPLEQAYGSLKMCVYRTRKQLGTGIVETTQRGYRLWPQTVVDTRFLPQIVRAVRARSTGKAIESRLGTIFERLVKGRPAAYASWEWFHPIEREFHTAAREIGAYLAERALREARAGRALEIAHALAAVDPLDETARELEIKVYLSRGDRASALHAYRAYAADLSEQHGMEPSAALRALIESTAS